MTDDGDLIAAPVVVAASGDGVIVKRGSVEMQIVGGGAELLVNQIFDSFLQPRRSADVVQELPEALRESAVELIGHFVDRGLLRSSDQAEAVPERIESPAELFLWEQGVTAAQVTATLAARHFTVVGVNLISRQLVEALGNAGFANITVVDQPSLRNVRMSGDIDGLGGRAWHAGLPEPVALEDWELVPEETTCLIATSDFGGSHLLRAWNAKAVAAGVPFLPVVLQTMVGYVGPIVIPGETACFECLRARQNSHMENPETKRAAEGVAYETQLLASYLPSMTSIVGDMAAIELIKFFFGRIGDWRVGKLVEVDLQVPRIDVRRVLKVPRCSVCGDTNTASEVSLERNIFTPNQLRRGRR